jgi:hypothetical protein
MQIERLRAQKVEEDCLLDETRALNAVLGQRVADLESDFADCDGPVRELDALEAENMELMQTLSLLIDEHFEVVGGGASMTAGGDGEGAEGAGQGERAHGVGEGGCDEAGGSRRRKSTLQGGAHGAAGAQGNGRGGQGGPGASHGSGGGGGAAADGEGGAGEVEDAHKGGEARERACERRDEEMTGSRSFAHEGHGAGVKRSLKDLLSEVAWPSPPPLSSLCVSSPPSPRVMHVSFLSTLAFSSARSPACDM